MLDSSSSSPFPASSDHQQQQQHRPPMEGSSSNNNHQNTTSSGGDRPPPPPSNRGGRGRGRGGESRGEGSRGPSQQPRRGGGGRRGGGWGEPSPAVTTHTVEEVDDDSGQRDEREEEQRERTGRSFSRGRGGGGSRGGGRGGPRYGRGERSSTSAETGDTTTTSTTTTAMMMMMMEAHNLVKDRPHGDSPSGRGGGLEERGGGRRQSGNQSRGRGGRGGSRRPVVETVDGDPAIQPDAATTSTMVVVEALNLESGRDSDRRRLVVRGGGLDEGGGRSRGNGHRNRGGGGRGRRDGGRSAASGRDHSMNSETARGTQHGANHQHREVVESGSGRGGGPRGGRGGGRSKESGRGGRGQRGGRGRGGGRTRAVQSAPYPTPSEPLDQDDDDDYDEEGNDHERVDPDADDVHRDVVMESASLSMDPTGPVDVADKGNSKNQRNNQNAGPKSSETVRRDSEPSKSASGKGRKGMPPAGPLPLAPSVPPNQPQSTNDPGYARGENITVLHVAEKPSIAQAIAKGLAHNGGDDANYRSKSLPVHEFSGPAFPKAPQAQNCWHKVTSVAGHVFSVDFPSQYQSWDSVDPSELFQAPIVRKPCKGSVVKHLQDEAKGVNFIVLWMDCDREGENINFEVLDCCMNLMKSGGTPTQFDRVYRAFFSAINPSDIQKAYHALGKPDRNQALSVDARQELDLKVGVAFSRFQTRFFQGRYGDLNSAVLSYGPCQTPTLGFCVQRHVDIETFKPEPYWTLELGVTKRGRVMRALWDSGRTFNKSKAEALLQQALESSHIAQVVEVVTKDKKQGHPVPLNTVGLLKACSKALGIGPHSAMQSAERLYLSGYLSYPRTESTAYPKSFDVAGTLQQQQSDGRWGPYVRDLLKQGYTKSKGGVDMGDHPPITPCRSAGPGQLSGDMERIYDLVVRHFIASVSPDAQWRSTRVSFAIEALGDKGRFTLRGKQLVSPGFLEVLLHKEYGEDTERQDDDNGEEEEEEERLIPEFNEGEMIPLVNSRSTSNSTKIAVASSEPVRATLDMREKMTTPPKYLTESELIGLMEKNGIGTDASIPTHIENIQNRNYVTLETGRRLIPTKLGLVLVQGYHQIDSSLVLPQVRSDIEDQCNKIAKGQASKDDVVARAIELFRAKFDTFVSEIAKMDVLFSSSFSKLEDVGKPFTRCGHTRRYLQYIPGPPPRLYNKWTETVHPLPSGGIAKQWTGRHCSVENCKFELCLYSVGQPQRTFPLCPRCFNDPDWALEGEEFPEDADDREDEAKERKIRKMAGKALVLECPLPDDHPVIEELTVSDDAQGDGVLILDPHFGPKWRLVATRDPTIVHLPQCIDKMLVLDKRDEALDVRLMQVEFKEGQSPLPDGQLKYVTCYPTDTLLQGMSRTYHGSERTASSGRGRGRGRGGRGRGGRGRGGRGRGRRD